MGSSKKRERSAPPPQSGGRAESFTPEVVRVIARLQPELLFCERRHDWCEALTPVSPSRYCVREKYHNGCHVTFQGLQLHSLEKGDVFLAYPPINVVVWE